VTVSKAKRRPLRLLGAAGVVGGGSSVPAAGSSSPASGGGEAAMAPPSLCQKTGGVLADGPDSDADPAGAALSQTLPLGDIPTSDTSVIHTVSKLVSAHQSSYNSDGAGKTAATAVEKADASLHKACPGVSS
jgi:hypothetical protein